MFYKTITMCLEDDWWFLWIEHFETNSIKWNSIDSSRKINLKSRQSSRTTTKSSANHSSTTSVNLGRYWSIGSLANCAGCIWSGSSDQQIQLGSVQFEFSRHCQRSCFRLDKIRIATSTTNLGLSVVVVMGIKIYSLSRVSDGRYINCQGTWDSMRVVLTDQ